MVLDLLITIQKIFFPRLSIHLVIRRTVFRGSDLLITPLIYQDHLTENVCLPSTERWYNYYTSEEITKSSLITEWVPRYHLLLYLSGGQILPHQQSAAINTVLSHQKPFYCALLLINNSILEEIYFETIENRSTPMKQWILIIEDLISVVKH